MARDKTVIDVLAELAPDELARMLQRNQRDLDRAKTEIARLELQEQQLEAALQKRERGKPGRPGSLTPEIVLDAASETEPPMSAGAVQQTLKDAGVEASVNAVRNHLNRLVEQGDLKKDERSRYSLATPDFPPASNPFIPAGAETFPEGTDDVPF